MAVAFQFFAIAVSMFTAYRTGKYFMGAQVIQRMVDGLNELPEDLTGAALVGYLKAQEEVIDELANELGPKPSKIPFRRLLQDIRIVGKQP